MVKVLHILWSAHFGGIERLVLDLATVQLNNPEIQIGILFGKKEGEFLEKFGKTGLTCYSINLKSGYDISPWKYLRAIQVFRNYDILHVHSFNPFLASCAVISRKKIFYTDHGSGSGIGRKRTYADYLKGIFLKIFLNSQVDYISFNSYFTKKIAEKRYGLNGVNRSVVYNGIAFRNVLISLKDVEQSILDKLRGKFVVGTASRFAGMKRIDRLIRAFAEFQKDRDTVLLLVGDGPLFDELEQLVKALKLSEKAIFTGFRDNVQAFQNLMDVCVFPSESEPFGLVAVETLSLGKPTIVFQDGGGIIEVVGGFSQDDIVKNVQHLIERLNFYYDHRDEITECAQRRKEYSQKFDINNMTSEINIIYKHLLSMG